MDKSFDEGEFNELCLVLGVDRQNLPGDTKRRIILSLLSYLTRRRELERLLEELRVARPNVEWPSIPQEGVGEREINLVLRKHKQRNVTANRKSLMWTAVFLVFLLLGFLVYVLSHDNRLHYFQVYADAQSPNNHFSPTGFMGDTENIKVEEVNENTLSGDTVMKITFEPKSDGSGWGGIIWQYPQQNWGTVDEGYNLEGYSYVTFWARSEVGQPTKFTIGGVGYQYGSCQEDVKASFPETFCPAFTVTCNLTNSWAKFGIEIPKHANLNHIVGGFQWSSSEPITLYLDDIYWVENPSDPDGEGAAICHSED